MTLSLQSFIDDTTVVGVCKADILNDIVVKVEAYQKGLSKVPKDYISDAKSVIVVGSAVDAVDDVYKREFLGASYPGYGKAFAKGKQIAEYLKSHGFKAKLARELSTKNAAYHAGLGVWGKNSLILNPLFGSRLRFDCIITNWIPGSYDVPMFVDLCGDCVECLNSCPFNCLEPYKVDARKCHVKYIDKTNRDKILPMCPVCQNVCKLNKM